MAKHCPLLIPFWIEGTEPRGPHGFGVTAWSVDAAFVSSRNDDSKLMNNERSANHTRNPTRPVTPTWEGTPDPHSFAASGTPVLILGGARAVNDEVRIQHTTEAVSRWQASIIGR
jgi:hypothetical protein